MNDRGHFQILQNFVNIISFISLPYCIDVVDFKVENIR